MASDISICRARSRPELQTVLEVAERVSGPPVPAVDELEHALASEPGTLFLIAYLGTDAAASGVGKVSSLSGCLFAMVRVLPELRRKGVGRAMYAALSDHARRVGLEELFGRVREDDEGSLAALGTHGFREIGRDFPVVLDLRTGRKDRPPAPDGVEITTLADRPDLLHAAWEVELEAAPDIPTEGGVEAWPFNRWRSTFVDAPTALPEASFIALIDGEVVGSAVLTALSDGAAEHGLTAVRRAWRGRGIATALKRAQIEWAREAGYTALHTSNDETNLAMRGINKRLGYEPIPGYVMVRGPLAG
jgi:GNAT superfamily N-acetyltransferase